MHIKHYHPEMCKFFGDTPNVADLAYARTVVEESPVQVCKNQFRSEVDKYFGKYDILLNHFHDVSIVSVYML